jgi:hypothetical protein
MDSPLCPPGAAPYTGRERRSEDKAAADLTSHKTANQTHLGFVRKPGEDPLGTPLMWEKQGAQFLPPLGEMKKKNMADKDT